MTEITFEEQFPSLKNFNCMVDERIPINWIQKYCIDKQKVKEAIDKQIKENQNECYINATQTNNSVKFSIYMEFDTRLKIMLNELGLE